MNFVYVNKLLNKTVIKNICRMPKETTVREFQGTKNGSRVHSCGQIGAVSICTGMQSETSFLHLCSRIYYLVTDGLHLSLAVLCFGVGPATKGGSVRSSPVIREL